MPPDDQNAAPVVTETPAATPTPTPTPADATPPAREASMPSIPDETGTPPIGESFRRTMGAIQKGERRGSKLQAIAAAPEEEKPAKPEGDETEPEGEEKDGKPDEKAAAEAAEKAAAEKTAAEAKAGDKKGAPKEAKSPEDAQAEAEIKTLPVREQKRVKFFITKAGEAQAAQRQAEAKVAELEKQVAELTEKAGKLPEDVQKQLDQLSIYRRRFDLESDPEVQNRFNKRIADGEAVIMETLKTSPLFGPFVEEKIKAAGSFRAFLRSKQEYAIKTADGKREMVTGAEIYARLVGSMELADSDILRQTVADQQRTEKEKANFVAEESKKANEHFAEESKKANETQVKWNAKLAAVKEGAKLLHKEASEKLDWLKDEPAKEGATPEEKAQLKETNKLRADLRASLQATLDNPIITHAAALVSDKQAGEDLRDLILDAHRAQALDRQLELANKQIAQLQADLKTARSGSKTTTSPGVITSKAAPAGAENGSSDMLPGESPFRYSLRTGKQPPAAAATS